MVRVNLINPKNLTDQHLIAEYNEILMLLGHLKKHGIKQKNIPTNYVLGKGHINFFKNKLRYLKNRHEFIKKEMQSRGFSTNKTISLSKFNKSLHKNWKPSNEDKKLIKSRLKQKILKKPGYYRYYKKPISLNRYLKYLKNSK